MKPQYVDFIVEGKNFYFKIQDSYFHFNREKYESMCIYHEKDDKFQVQISFTNSELEFWCKQRSTEDEKVNPIQDPVKRKECVELILKHLQKNLMEGIPIGLACCGLYVYDFIFTK